MKELPNIVLVGFMGTGKTSVGKRVAERLAYRFVDMDDVIVERAGKSIPRIFEEDGEAHFRELERAVARSLSAEFGLVVATGGGVVLNPDNIADYAGTGLVICLSATPEAILDRVRHDTNRPLLNADDKIEKITGILSVRQARYDAVPLQVDTTNLAEDEVVERVLALYNDAGRADNP